MKHLLTITLLLVALTCSAQQIYSVTSMRITHEAVYDSESNEEIWKELFGVFQLSSDTSILITKTRERKYTIDDFDTFIEKGPVGIVVQLACTDENGEKSRIAIKRDKINTNYFLVQILGGEAEEKYLVQHLTP